MAQRARSPAAVVLLRALTLAAAVGAVAAQSCGTFTPPSGAVYSAGVYGRHPWYQAAQPAWTDGSAHWIWNTDGADRGAAPGIPIFFYATVTHAGATETAATVAYSGDDRAVLHVNGVYVGRDDDWMTVATQAVTLKPGLNIFEIEATNGVGPAGLVASIVSSDGTVLLNTGSLSRWTWSLARVPYISACPLPPSPSSVVQLQRTQATGRAFPTLRPDSATNGALSIAVTATRFADDAEAAWRTLFNFSGLACTVHASSINVAAPGAPELVVPNFMTISNQNGASTRCSQGVYLTSASPGFASWPLNTPATLTFDVDVDGNLGVPAIGGVPFELVPFPKDDTWVPACARVRLGTEEALYIGAAGDGGDEFVGDITDVTIMRVGTE
jgi:hypothetical protein